MLNSSLFHQLLSFEAPWLITIPIIPPCDLSHTFVALSIGAIVLKPNLRFSASKCPFIRKHKLSNPSLSEFTESVNGSNFRAHSSGSPLQSLHSQRIYASIRGAGLLGGKELEFCIKKNI